MKLHNSTIEKLVNLYDLWGGHRENKKLKQMLNTLKFHVHLDQDSKQVYLVLKDD
tara:strand:+ start:413 stop:577 length:165 start_codon:yes stop_codon:yes gene_type:complete